MGYLKHIEVENFKSWKGKQVIGPFKQFNCIIGTNGSGKSNVMDALSFVLGERAASLRVKRTRDLIHGAHIGRPVAPSAAVAMLYCEEDGQELEFRRVVTGDSSEYYINGSQVNLVRYTAELQKIGVVVKARNCLVFQGAVESIAMKSPKELSRMFERISGSLDLAEEYVQKKEALQKAKEDTQFNFKKKKTAVAEKRQVSQVQEEATRYQSLVDNLTDSKVQLSLYQLYHNHSSINALLESIQAKQVLVDGKKNTREVWEKAVRSQKKEYGRHSRALQLVEKEICVLEQRLTQQRPFYIKAKVNTTHQKHKVEEAHAGLQKVQTQQQRKREELEEMRHELTDLEHAWRHYEREAQKKQVIPGVAMQLEEAQLERYRELKEMSRIQGATWRQQAEKLRWEAKADTEKLEFDQRRKKEIEANIKQYQAQMEDFKRREIALEEYVNTSNLALEQHRIQEESLCQELDEGRVRSEELSCELSKVLVQLQTARIDHQESRRQKQQDELLESLRRLYPETLFGRLVELCNPIHKKYQLAVTKVFGRYMNAIVVASEKVARECIKFVKEERGEPETFLPMDYIEVNPLNERLREVRGAKLLVDVVQCAPQLKKVVQFVCGNALVCETLKEAQHIAFGGPQRLKTVALDGTMFSKSGVISGGSTYLRTKAHRWDDKEMSKLKERKEKLAAELHGLLKLKRKEVEMKQVQAQAKGTQNRLKSALSDMEYIRKKSVPACQAEKSKLDSELVNLLSEIQMQKENVEKKQLQIQSIQDKVNKMEDSIFAEFCAEIEVDNIRVYEQEYLKQQQEVEKKRLEFDNQKARLSTQLEYEQSRLEQEIRRNEKLLDIIRMGEEKITEHKKEEQRLLKDVNETLSKLQELKNSLTMQKSHVTEVKVELDRNVKGLQECCRELVKLQKEAISLEAALEQKRLEKHNMLLDCKVQGLPIVLLSGCLDEVSEVQLESETQTTVGTMDIYEREGQIIIDYSPLRRELRELQGEEIEAELEKLQEAITTMESLIQRSSMPNLKVLEKMREVKEKFQGVVDAFDASAKQARKCHQEFEKIKARRFHLFNQCLEHVSVAIDQIYKELCQNSSAQAILSAENPDEPYLDGISYNCVAPGKRFMSMDNLSGGEKSIAALALVFALHSFRPAPFFVLDEVDAALDNTNIGKVTSYIREQSREYFQVIVISLKEEFYSRAEALLGVYSDFNECMFSRLLTLDLTPYPIAEEAVRDEV